MFGFLYSVVAYLAFLTVFNALALFSNGLLLPKTVDSGEPTNVAFSLAINLGLLLAWGVQHSVMARAPFKQWLTRFVPPHLERSTYVLASSLTLAAVMLFWQPVGGVLWHVDEPILVATLWAVNALGWLGVPVVSFLIDHFDLFGLKQSFARWRKQSFAAQGFVTPWLYRYVRHPMMTAMMVALWTTPTMTASHLCFALGLTLYIAVGVHFEERSLLRELGEEYAAYKTRTPKFFPRLGQRRDAVSAPSLQS